MIQKMFIFICCLFVCLIRWNDEQYFSISFGPAYESSRSIAKRQLSLVDRLNNLFDVLLFLEHHWYRWCSWSDFLFGGEQLGFAGEWRIYRHTFSCAIWINLCVAVNDWSDTCNQFHHFNIYFHIFFLQPTNVYRSFCACMCVFFHFRRPWAEFYHKTTFNHLRTMLNRWII